MESTGDLIQIVIPCFNGEEFLEETLHSIQNQTYENFDCLLIDDGSTDRTADIFSVFEQHDSRFRSLTNSQNMGESFSVNRGWANKSGKLITIMSCDDPQPNDWLKEMVKFSKINVNKKHIVYYPNRSILDASGRVVRREYLLDWDYRTLNEDFICIPSVGAIIDTEKLPFDFRPRIEKVDYPSDLIQFLEISKFGTGLRHPTFFCNWRMHSGNKSAVDKEEFAKKFEIGVRNYLQYSGQELTNFQLLSLTCLMHRISETNSHEKILKKSRVLIKSLARLEPRLLLICSALTKISLRFVVRKFQVAKNRSLPWILANVPGVKLLFR